MPFFSDIQDVDPPAPAVAPPGGLADTPLEGELLDFTMRVPVGTEVRVERGAKPSYLLAESGEAPTWRARIAPLLSSRPGVSAAEQVEAYLEELRAKGEPFEVLVNEPRAVAGTEARVYFIGVPLPDGGRGISGGFIVPHGRDRFLVFSILVLDSAFATARPLLEASLDTLTLIDRTEEIQARAELLGRGQAIIDAITPDTLRAASNGEGLVYRMWRPSNDGTREDFGFMVVRAREGARGEIDASRDPKSLEGEEAQRGLLATVDARVVVGNDPTHTFDVQSRYFVSFDRLTETWSIRRTERHRSASRSSAQTGIRIPSVGRPAPPLQVIDATTDGRAGEPRQWEVPPAYLSQAELIVLGKLLPRSDRLEDVEFLDYAYDQKGGRLPQRRERWRRTEDGGWRLETRTGTSPEVLVQEFAADGTRIRRTDPDGTVTERIELDELRALWKAKGLPVD